MNKPCVRHVHSSALADLASSCRRDDLVIPSDRPYDAFFWPDRACSAVSREHRPPFDLRAPPPTINELDFVASRVVTDRYRDAIDAFADVVAWMRAEQHTMRLVVSARDAGLPRLMEGGVPAEIEVVLATFAPSGFVNLLLHFDRNYEYSSILPKRKAYNSMSMVPPPLDSYGRGWTCAAATDLIRVRSAPTVHIRVDAADVRRDVECRVCWDFVSHPAHLRPCGDCRRPIVIAGPATLVAEQRRRLLPFSDADGARDYVVLPPHKKHVYDDGCFCRPRLAPSSDCCHRWRAAQHLLISFTLTLGATPMGSGFAHLPLYVLLEIFDMLPGATLYSHVNKVRTIEGVLMSMRYIRAARPEKRPHAVIER
jgi:hypothetical protein